MLNSKAKRFLEDTLTQAGITLNGNQPFDITINDQRAINRIVKEGSLGLGESYMNGWWNCEQLDELSKRLCAAALEKKAQKKLAYRLYRWSAKFFNFQTKNRAKEVAYKHYNLNNQLFARMLGPSMVYSCGYWKKAHTLQEAQTAKLDLICKKLQLTSGDTVLDIGCGWGSFAAYAAKNYGCRVVAFSIADNQIAYAKQHYKGLPIEFYTADYRDIDLYNPNRIRFNKLVSIGSFEHVGHKNYKKFFNLMKNQLREDGLFLLHTIGSNETTTAVDPWINKYIFPRGNLPSMANLATSLETIFLMEDWHNFGAYYDKTLMAWHSNFEMHWNSLKMNYDERFYRMWRYYLLICAGMFRSRTAQLWQLILSPSGVKGGYESFR